MRKALLGQFEVQTLVNKRLIFKQRVTLWLVNEIGVSSSAVEQTKMLLFNPCKTVNLIWISFVEIFEYFY